MPMHPPQRVHGPLLGPLGPGCICSRHKKNTLSRCCFIRPASADQLRDLGLCLPGLPGLTSWVGLSALLYYT